MTHSTSFSRIESLLDAMYLSLEVGTTIGWGLPGSPYMKAEGARGGCMSGIFIIYLHTLVMQIQNAIMIGLMFCRLSRGTSRRAMSQPELPSEYLLGSPKSSRSSQSPSASPRSNRSRKSGTSPRELRQLLQLKDTALQMLQEEIVQEALPQQLRMEARYHQLMEMLQDDARRSDEAPVTLLDKIGAAVQQAKLGKLHQIHAGTFHGYPEFEQAPELPYPVDKFGAASLIFTDKAVIREIGGKFFFMIQVCEQRKHQLVEAKIRCYALSTTVVGQTINGATGPCWEVELEGNELTCQHVPLALSSVAATPAMDPCFVPVPAGTPTRATLIAGQLPLNVAPSRALDGAAAFTATSVAIGWLRLCDGRRNVRSARRATHEDARKKVVGHVTNIGPEGKKRLRPGAQHLSPLAPAKPMPFPSAPSAYRDGYADPEERGPRFDLLPPPPDRPYLSHQGSLQPALRSRLDGTTDIRLEGSMGSVLPKTADTVCLVPEPHIRVLRPDQRQRSTAALSDSEEMTSILEKEGRWHQALRPEQEPGNISFNHWSDDELRTRLMDCAATCLTNIGTGLGLQGPTHGSAHEEAAP
eukprot:s41_g30.t2